MSSHNSTSTNKVNQENDVKTNKNKDNASKDYNLDILNIETEKPDAGLFDRQLEEERQLAENKKKQLTTVESVLNNSRISPTGDPGGLAACTPPTSGQKWWAAVLLGVVFFILRSPLVDAGISAVSVALGGMPLTYGHGATLVLLIIETLIFIIIVRIILA